MSDIIKLLPDNIANQIAAGEVVQRPASAVKELLENAIDAESDDIQLVIKDSGKTLIQVIDNGKGMSMTDARMSFERHATSKIKKAEDLFCIYTMGFRGEALASIAAVAQVELHTKQKENDIGTSVFIEGGKFIKQEPEAMVDGTKIVVKNLFFNIPARRNFLKSNTVELRHIMDEFCRSALAHPEISFSCFQNDLEVYKLKAGKLSQRIVALFGKNYQQQLIPINEESEYISINGYVGKPEFSKKARGDQYFFVNKRFIKNNYLNIAVSTAFSGLIPTDHYPFFVINIEIDPKHIDVNVHPTKTEIKFDDDKTIFNFIKSAVRKALGSYNIAPSLDFTVDTNFMSKLPSSNFGLDNANRDFDLNKKQQDYNRFKGSYEEEKRKESNLKNWEELFEGALETETFTSEVNRETSKEKHESGVLTFSSAANRREPDTSYATGLPRENTVFQILNKFVATPVRSGMMVIDQQKAYQRILFEKYLRQLAKGSGSTQQLLFQEKLELSPKEYVLALQMKAEIQALGFIYEDFGHNTIVLSGVPNGIVGNSVEIFKGLLHDYENSKEWIELSSKERLAAIISKNAASSFKTSMMKEEMTGLIDQLFACENPNYSPNGSITYRILEEKDLVEFFNK